MKRQEFIDYCWSFYGPRQLYGDFFGHTLTRGELEEAVDKRMQSPDYEGDSVDREKVRDMMLDARKAFLARRKRERF